MTRKFENDLDRILFERMIETMKAERNQKISLDVNDLLEDGHSIQDIENSLKRIAEIDARTVFEETKDIPNMTIQ